VRLPYMMRTLLSHVRRGLLRLYLAIAVPWVAWFGYQIFNAFQHHPYGSVWRYASDAFWSLLIVPIGGPILFFMIIWIVAGFRKFNEATSQSEPPSQPSTVDYYAFISRAVSELNGNTAEAREALYERARTALVAQLHRQDPPVSSSQIEIERAALGSAIRRLEKDEQSKERLRTRELKKPSTALLIASMFFPGLWALDFTSMSIYWVARLPRTSASRHGSSFT
jgi:hypothetical protein